MNALTRNKVNLLGLKLCIYLFTTFLLSCENINNNIVYKVQYCNHYLPKNVYLERKVNNEGSLHYVEEVFVNDSANFLRDLYYPEKYVLVDSTLKQYERIVGTLGINAHDTIYIPFFIKIDSCYYIKDYPIVFTPAMDNHCLRIKENGIQLTKTAVLNPKFLHNYIFNDNQEIIRIEFINNQDTIIFKKS